MVGIAYDRIGLEFAKVKEQPDHSRRRLVFRLSEGDANPASHSQFLSNFARKSSRVGFVFLDFSAGKFPVTGEGSRAPLRHHYRNFTHHDSGHDYGQRCILRHPIK